VDVVVAVCVFVSGFSAVEVGGWEVAVAVVAVGVVAGVV
jgi:hypothetical protein